MTEYIFPHTAMRNTKSGRAGALGVKGNKLAVWNKADGMRVIAPDWDVIERQAVAGWLTGILLDAWLQFAHRNGDSLNSGGLSVLEDIEEVLRVARLIDSDGQPRKEMTLPLGAGGLLEE